MQAGLAETATIFYFSEISSNVKKMFSQERNRNTTITKFSREKEARALDPSLRFDF